MWKTVRMIYIKSENQKGRREKLAHSQYLRGGWLRISWHYCKTPAYQFKQSNKSQ